MFPALTGTPKCPTTPFEVGLTVTGLTQTSPGGYTPLSYTIVPASGLPSGLSISATTGTISGTPATSTALTSYSFMINVSDSNGHWKASPTCAGTVAAALAATCPPSSLYYEVNAPFSYLQASPVGVAPLAYSVNSPSRLPAGLSINPTSGAITGTPTATGTVSYVITVRDNVGVTRTSPTCGGTGMTRGSFGL